jgi:PKHD-type hydroxylase
MSRIASPTPPYRYAVGPLATNGYREVVTRPLYSPDECDRLIGCVQDGDWKLAEVTRDEGYGSRTDARVRSASTQNLPAEAAWAVERLVRAIASVNEAVFRYRLWGVPISDVPSVVRYRANEGGHFSPHIDAGVGMSTRKITYVVQLSDPSTYDGGDLVIQDGGKAAVKDRGALTLFPSMLTHVVSPVVQGERYALIGWVHGPTLA